MLIFYTVSFLDLFSMPPNKQRKDNNEPRQLLTEKKSMHSTAKSLGKTLSFVQMKTFRLGLVVVDESEKNTPSTTTFTKLVLPIESCIRRSTHFGRRPARDL